MSGVVSVLHRLCMSVEEFKVICLYGADIFSSLSPSKPRSEVAYCIHSLARRLNQTNNWAVCSSSSLLIIIIRWLRFASCIGYTRKNTVGSKVYTTGRYLSVRFTLLEDISR
jgi:hypothetical protein